MIGHLLSSLVAKAPAVMLEGTVEIDEVYVVAPLFILRPQGTSLAPSRDVPRAILAPAEVRPDMRPIPCWTLLPMMTKIPSVGLARRRRA